MECDHLQCPFVLNMVGNSLDDAFYDDFVHCCEHVQPRIQLHLISIQYRPADNTSPLYPGNNCKILALVHPINPIIQTNPMHVIEILIYNQMRTRFFFYFQCYLQFLPIHFQFPIFVLNSVHHRLNHGHSNLQMPLHHQGK